MQHLQGESPMKELILDPLLAVLAVVAPLGLVYLVLSIQSRKLQSPLQNKSSIQNGNLGQSISGSLIPEQKNQMK
jgi:hypothetical protein